MNKSIIDRFFAKVNKLGKTMPHMKTRCWEWTACRNSNGYGRLNINGKVVLAHRVSWQIHHGEIPKGRGYHGTCVLHRCDNSICVNPDHLFLGTQLDNIRDRDNKYRQGDHAGERNGRSKLTESQVIKIRRIYLDGAISHRHIARMFNVSKTTAGDILRRNIWKHI